jgi:rfaE bifunctional protein kinase chain/domain
MTHVAAFKGRRVAVFGDAVCDRWLFAEPSRLSREAPVMVLSHKGERMGAGGAANVARNLVALGAEVSWIGAVGADASGREVVRLLEEEGVDTQSMRLVPEWTTPTKTRVLAAEPRRALAGALEERGATFDAVLFSDYEYGCLGVEAAQVGRALAQAGTPVVLDPRRAALTFHGFSAWTPNVGELSLLTGIAEGELSESSRLADAALALLEESRCRWLLVTRGNQGMALFGEGLPVGGAAVEASGSGDVTDVCGAGDTAASVFALGLAAGVEPVEAMMMANAAAGVVVREQGAAVCGSAALEEALVGASPPVRLADVGVV